MVQRMLAVAKKIVNLYTKTTAHACFTHRKIMVPEIKSTIPIPIPRDKPRIRAKSGLPEFVISEHECQQLF